MLARKDNNDTHPAVGSRTQLFPVLARSIADYAIAGTFAKVFVHFLSARTVQGLLLQRSICRNYRLTELNRPPKLYGLEHCVSLVSFFNHLHNTMFSQIICTNLKQKSGIIAAPLITSNLPVSYSKIQTLRLFHMFLLLSFQSLLNFPF